MKSIVAAASKTVAKGVLAAEVAAGSAWSAVWTFPAVLGDWLATVTSQFPVVKRENTTTPRIVPSWDFEVNVVTVFGSNLTRNSASAKRR